MTLEQHTRVHSDKCRDMRQYFSSLPQTLNAYVLSQQKAVILGFGVKSTHKLTKICMLPAASNLLQLHDACVFVVGPLAFCCLRIKLIFEHRIVASLHFLISSPLLQQVCLNLITLQTVCV